MTRKQDTMSPILAIAAMLVALGLGGCGKLTLDLTPLGLGSKPAENATVIEPDLLARQWRLVETSKPSTDYGTLSDTNHVIFKFDGWYSGTVTRVENGLRADKPSATFDYVTDDEIAFLAITFRTPPATEGGTESVEMVEYTYEVSATELRLVEKVAGHSYRFVPYGD